MEKEKKYNNSAFFTLCQEVFKVRSVEGLAFIEECFDKVEDYDDCNKMGCSIRMLINERGTDKLKKIMECTEWNKEWIWEVQLPQLS